MKQISTLIFLAIPFYLISQPNTEVYIGSLKKGGIIDLKNISKNEGYDNQPSFWNDSRSVIYARTINGQTEIMRYFLKSQKQQLISNTLQGGEYSPTQIPKTQKISSIRLDTTGLQLLYEYDLDGQFKVLVPELKIGYHAWLNTTQMIAFVLGDTATLQFIDLDKGIKKIIDQPGRSMHKIPGTKFFSFVDKSSLPWTINRLDPSSFEIEEITQTVANAEDYCWTPKRELMMASDAEIYQWKKKWIKFADLSTYGIKNITRIAISPDGKKIAIAAE